MELERLLVIIDAEHDEQPALQRAVWLARRTGAHLHLLQIDYHPGLDSGLLDGRLLGRARDALLHERRDELEARVAHLRNEGLSLEVEVRWGKRRHEEILARAAVLQPDILFKSTHPSSVLRRLLLSDTSWQLIRRSQTPVWLVHNVEWQGERLCAALDPLHTDDKPAALDHQLIRNAIGLEKQLDLQAHYLHCQTPLPHSLLVDPEVQYEYERYVSSSIKAHKEAFDQMVGQYGIGDLYAHLIEGSPEDAIPRFVREHNIDLLLMGAVARGHLDTLLIGHTAERVLERVECDLLVIKPQPTGSA